MCQTIEKIKICMKFNIPFEKKPFLLSIILNLGLFILNYLLFVPAFNTNDDVGMMLKVSGISNFAESTHLMLYSNVIIGYILEFFYKLFGNFIWYEMYLVLAMYLSFVTFFYVCFNSVKNKIVALLLYILYFIFVGTSVLLNPQFTLEATLLVIAGLLLIFFPFNKATNKWELIGGSILIIFGNLIRNNSIFLAFLVFLPVLLIYLKNNWKFLLDKKNLLT
jgi:hypothetical protein